MKRRTVPCILCAVLLLALMGFSRTATAASELNTSLTVTVTGASVTFTVQICNQGPASPATTAGLYLDRTTAPTCSTTPDHTWNVPSIKNAACETLTHTATVAEGSYTAWAMADQGCIVSETDEADNVVSKTYSVFPDFSISSFTVSATGSSVTYTITVKNLGTATTKTFDVGLYYNRSTAPSCSTSPDVTFTITGLAAGATATKTHTQTGVAGGSYKAYAFADQGCAVQEKSETNNSAYKNYALGPNVAVFTPTVMVNGTNVTYNVQLCNSASSAATGAFTVGLWYHLASAPSCGAAGADHTWSVTDLAVGACTTVTHNRLGAPGGSYTARVFADPDCVLTETKENDNKSYKAYTVGTPTASDLYISSFSATVSNTSVTYKSTVCNQGATISGSIDVALVYDSAAEPTCSTAADHTWNLAGLSQGACQTVTHVRSSTPNGSYKAWVLADAGCVVAEDSEANNAKHADYGVGQDEVYVKTFSVSVVGNEAQYNAQICNGGNAVTSGFSVAIYYDRQTAPTCSDSPDYNTTLSSLSGGACSLVSTVEQGAPVGTKKAWVLADSLCQLIEGNETNNLKYYQYGVGVEQPDLRISNFTVTVSGLTVAFMATVCNYGAVDSPAFELGVFYDKSVPPVCGDEPSWIVAIDGLQPGNCDTHTHKMDAQTTGVYQAWAAADALCVVGESDEDNNSSGHSYKVTAQQADLTVTVVSAEVTADRVVYTATVCNAGGEQAAATQTGIYFDRQSAPTCADKPSQSLKQDPLEAGECANQVWVRTGAPAGSYSAWAMADATCVLGETDETNNALSQDYSVVGGGDGGPTEGGDGCSCTLAVAPRGPQAAGLLLAGLLLLWRRRRRPDGL
jgi:MYXO-CTERM domain-containing protein